MGGFEVVEVGFCLCEVGLQFTILCFVISFVQLIDYIYILFIWILCFFNATKLSCSLFSFSFVCEIVC